MRPAYPARPGDELRAAQVCRAVPRWAISALVVPAPPAPARTESAVMGRRTLAAVAGAHQGEGIWLRALCRDGTRSVPARGFVLLHHAGRDAAAFADRQAMLLRPGPDITRTLPAGRRPPGPAGRRLPGLPGVLDVRREQVAEHGGVLGAQVDLITGALDGEPHGLIRRAAGQVVLQHHRHFLRHHCLP